MLFFIAPDSFAKSQARIILKTGPPKKRAGLFIAY